MSRAPSPRPTLGQALAVFVPGLVIAALSVGRAAASFASVDTTPSLLPMFALFVGGVLFAIGGIMLLVVVVRPLFSDRPSDTLADQTADTNRKR